MSFVSTERGAVSFGVLAFSRTLDFLSLLDLGAGDLEIADLLVLNGESVRPLVERPLLVRTPSVSVLERGVGGLCRYDKSSS